MVDVIMFPLTCIRDCFTFLSTQNVFNLGFSYLDFILVIFFLGLIIDYLVPSARGVK